MGHCPLSNNCEKWFGFVIERFLTPEYYLFTFFTFFRLSKIEFEGETVC